MKCITQKGHESLEHRHHHVMSQHASGAEHVPNAKRGTHMYSTCLIRILEDPHGTLKVGRQTRGALGREHHSATIDAHGKAGGKTQVLFVGKRKCA
jgi:hypothetical protein